MEFESIDVSPIFRKSWVCLGEYPEIYTTIYHLYGVIQWLYKGNMGTSSRFTSLNPSPGGLRTNLRDLRDLGDVHVEPLHDNRMQPRFRSCTVGDQQDRQHAQDQCQGQEDATPPHHITPWDPKKMTRKASKAHLFPAGRGKGCILCVCVHPPEKKTNGHTDANVFKTRWKLLNESAEGSTTLETELETQKKTTFSPGVALFQTIFS